MPLCLVSLQLRAIPKQITGLYSPAVRGKEKNLHLSWETNCRRRVALQKLGAFPQSFMSRTFAFSIRNRLWTIDVSYCIRANRKTVTVKRRSIIHPMPYLTVTSIYFLPTVSPLRQAAERLKKMII